MHGYLRRKVTSNLGKGGPVSNPSTNESAVDNPSTANLSLNPFSWFNDMSITNPSEYFIIDGFQEFPIDNDYRDRGVSEGWLSFHSYRYDKHGNLVYLYSHRHTAPE